jgi:glutamate-5-semialdehyde dehydrogenase
MSKELQAKSDLILEANTLDLETCRDQHVADWILEGMKLTPERLQRVAQQVLSLAKLPDPIGVVDRSWRSDQGTGFNRYRVPLGVIALIYEIYPEFAIAGMSMALKSGNGMILSSSGAISRTHQAVVSLLSEAAYSHGIPEGAIQLVPEEELQPFQAGISSTLPLLQQSRYVDLVIPLGRPNWVEAVLQASTVPVLQTYLGYGNLFIDASANWNTIQSLVLNSLGNPTADILLQPVLLSLLIHPDWSHLYLDSLVAELLHRGFSLQVGTSLLDRFPHLLPIQEMIDSTEKPHLRLQEIPSVAEAISWINKYGSRQAEGIFSDSQSNIQRFIQEVDAATIYVNSSLLPYPRHTLMLGTTGQAKFSLGSSIQKLHVRGPIDLEAFTTIKYVAIGSLSSPLK